MMAHGLCGPCYKKDYRVGYYAIHKDNWRKYYGKNLRDIRDRVFQKLGNCCVRCGFSDSRAFQIDHVFGGGGKELRMFNTRRKAYYQKILDDTEGRYQLLCANCNWIKRHEKKEWNHQQFDAAVEVPTAEGALPESEGQAELSV
jgi:hypothetical protein